MSEALEKAQLAAAAAPSLASSSSDMRSEAIRAAAASVRVHAAEILAANEADSARGRENSMSEPMLDRLFLDEERVEALAASMEEVAELPDPLGRVVEGRTLANGIRMEKVTVPLGVVAMIYEARPNVTADAIALALRSGNACVLRGGSAAAASCKAIADACREGAVSAGLNKDVIQLIESTDRSETEVLMGATGLIDVLIPRGGASLIQSCVQNAKVPVIETGIGNCHIYVHETADVQMAEDILINAKTTRPGVCNAAESLLVDKAAAPELLPKLGAALSRAGVEMVADTDALAILEEAGLAASLASEEDFYTEFLDFKISIACVDGVERAVAHINEHGTSHSEAIVTTDYAAAEYFLQNVDAAAVYVNASTRFTDGGVFGLGCEIGISTQKLHARGPMGVEVLTSWKYLLRGEGQIR